MANKIDKQTSLEQSLLAYRCISTDKTLTWKQNYVIGAGLGDTARKRI